MINLSTGYYWMKNITLEGRVIHRPIEVKVLTESGYFFGDWFHAGTYILMIGSELVYNLSYFTDPIWKGLEFIKLDEPKKFQYFD